MKRLIFVVLCILVFAAGCDGWKDKKGCVKSKHIEQTEETILHYVVIEIDGEERDSFLITAEVFYEIQENSCYIFSDCSGSFGVGCSKVKEVNREDVQ